MTDPSKKAFILVLKKDNPNLKSVIDKVLGKTSKNSVKVLHPLPYKPHPTQPANYIPPAFSDNTYIYYYLALSHSIVKSVLEKRFHEEMLDYEVQDKEDFEETRREREEPKITKKLRKELRDKQEQNKRIMKEIQDLEIEKKNAEDALKWATIGKYAKFAHDALSRLDMFPESECPVTGVEFSFTNPPYKLNNCGHHVSYEATRTINGECPRCKIISQTYFMDLGGLGCNIIGRLANDLDEGKEPNAFKELTSDDLRIHYQLPLGLFVAGNETQHDQGEGQTRKENNTEPIRRSDDE